MASRISTGRPTNGIGARLSVGLPVYNGERFLEETLLSLLSQTFADFELIISDNASTDTTEAICRDYAQNDSRIRYHRNLENLGAAWNYNHVFRLASGEYFKWASHDDLCAPHFFERCVDVLDRMPDIVLCYPRTIIINGQGDFVKEYRDDLDLRSPLPAERFRQFHRVYRRPHLCNSIFGVLRSRTLAMTHLIGSYVSSDMVLLGELTLSGGIHEIPEPLFFRRDHPQASVRAFSAYRDRITWFDPRKKGKLQMIKWIWLREYLSAIRRAPLSEEQRARCYGVMGEWAIWNFGGLMKDIAKAILWPIIGLYSHRLGFRSLRQ